MKISFIEDKIDTLQIDLFTERSWCRCQGSVVCCMQVFLRFFPANKLQVLSIQIFILKLPDNFPTNEKENSERFLGITVKTVLNLFKSFEYIDLFLFNTVKYRAILIVK